MLSLLAFLDSTCSDRLTEVFITRRVMMNASAFIRATNEVGVWRVLSAEVFSLGVTC